MTDIGRQYPDGPLEAPPRSIWFRMYSDPGHGQDERPERRPSAYERRADGGNTMATGTRTRAGNGKFIRTAASIKRDHRAAELRGQGFSFDRIAAELGFASRGKAHEAVMRAYAEIPSEESEQAKRLDLERIDRLIEKAWEIMLRDHVTVSNGRVVGKVIGAERDEDGLILRDGDGKPVLIYEDILDDGPALAAIREIRGLLERRAKMTGYDAPVRSRIEVITEETVDSELAKLEAQLAEHDAPGPRLT